ncbi:hypothetical protein HUT06_26185 [Actinomadura sp. NAK00032]|uniref:NACHT domain-containing protein n=1 Tax=Actinomadura sp. NAK00032 TaxID=2742128 RepID=UPI001590D0E6|nr:hypothetical protein [Actinomadura sp. NAK00032]QKW37068.1 hypothetical protein HUT06_26185 [Actinomadura sp. NAK00032]
MRGLGRFDRTQRLTAAHQIIVLTGYFEALSGVEPPIDLRELRLVQLATGQDVSGERLRALASILNDSDVPEVSDPKLEEFYASLSERLIGYLEARGPLGVGVRETLQQRIPVAAVRQYEQHLRQLAGQFPEVAFWAGRHDNRTTQMGLAGLQETLDHIASGRAPDERRQALARRYRRILDRPVLAAGDVPEGLALPSLAEAYVNPAYRSYSVGPSDRIDDESFWNPIPVGEDLQSFLISYLTSLRVAEGPLIVLGQPGSGKSLLTQVLAARLPVTDFLAVRVVLREVPADTDLQSQIEFAIRDATGDHLTWPALARASSGAMPVLLLDGFDELLQATGVGQTDYLEQIARFQEREADQGRPVAVIITSRTAVADRARIPRSGAVAVRLEPFDEARVDRWLTVWNAVNTPHLAARGLRPLPLDAVLKQPACAEQPLLLLMLALYDAADNALQRHSEALDEADLYERIIMAFAEREVRKSHPELNPAELGAAVEEELLCLSVAAFAMFNRGRQWASEEELTADLAALLEMSAPHAAGFAKASSPAQTVISRFFFIHQAQAVRADLRLTTCEFLHATFGEFLIARLIARELADLAAVLSVSTSRTRRPADDGFLRALLSFAPLTLRGKVVEFLTGLITAHSPQLCELLLDGFRTAHDAQRDWGQENYEPVRLGAPARCAALSANLLLLLLLPGSRLTARALFPDATFPVEDWRRHTLLWRTQFKTEGWRNLVATLRLDRIWNGDERDILISSCPGGWDPPPLDGRWLSNTPPGATYIGWRRMSTRELRRESYFACDLGQDYAWHGIEPLIINLDRDPDDAVNEGLTEFGVLSTNSIALSVAHTMIHMWLKSGEGANPDELQRAYRECVEAIERGRQQEATRSRNTHYSRVLRQLAADADRLPKSFRAELLEIFRRSGLLDVSSPHIEAWAAHAFGDLDQD